MIGNLLRSLVSSPLMRARIKNGINAASIAAGAWTLSHLYDWLMAHATYFSQTDNMAIAGTIASAIAGVVLTGGSVIYSTVVDPNTVNAKIIAVAATGDVTTASDPVVVADVKAAVKAVPGTPAALDDLVAKLSAGRV
jgi:hypothetical protein